MTAHTSAGAVRPFRIEVSDEALEDLQRRLGLLRRSTFRSPIRSSGSISRAAVVLEHWRDALRLARVERELNRFDHVLVEVDGLDVHAVHARGEGPSPLPLIIGHGWPSTFAEILPAVDLLTRPGEFGGDPADAFDVVIRR